jgi:hypothetical protein
MHKSLLSLGLAAAVPLLVAAAAASPASAHDGAVRPTSRWVTPANDKEAHVPIWFTLSIGGAEAAGFFKEATGFDSE